MQVERAEEIVHLVSSLTPYFPTHVIKRQSLALSSNWEEKESDFGMCYRWALITATQF